MRMKKLFTFGLVVAVISSIATISLLQVTAHANVLDDLFGGFFEKGASEGVSSTPVQEKQYESSISYEDAIIGTVEKSAPGVISIIVSKDLPVIENCAIDPFGNLPPEFKNFFGPFAFNTPCEKGTKNQEIGGGSGFIVSADGLIVTNKHVVADEQASYTVLTNDGQKYDATVLARDPVQDLAIVKIKTNTQLTVLPLGNSDTIRLGQGVVAIGNALGEFRNTVSAGIVSGLARSIDASGGADVEHLEGLIQTDAAINPGNSGGPLLNLKGEVIGINTAIASGAQNIGFTIPINQAKRDIESVKKTGKISLPFLGVRYVLLTPDLVDREKLPVTEGALIRGNTDGPGVIPNSPAAKAGLQAEDIITQLNNEAISQERSLSSLIQQYNVGDTVTMTIIRSGKTKKLTLVLGERT